MSKIGHLEPLMRNKTTSFAPTCLAIATDAKIPKEGSSSCL